MWGTSDLDGVIPVCLREEELDEGIGLELGAFRNSCELKQ